MQRKHWTRLENAEASLQPDEDQNGVVFFPLEGESIKKFDQRIRRWLSGQDVTGISTKYRNNIRFGVVRFVSAE
jgi:hypothetical protein